MTFNSKSKLNFRKLKISDYKEFSKLFYSCFKKKVSFDFYKWRYFSNKHSFCYGVFNFSKLIANVGIISLNINKTKSRKIVSRHSSMVLKNYRGQGIFSNLLRRVKKKFLKDVCFIIMWPNKNNYSNFDIDKKYIIEKKFYLYKTFLSKSLLKKTEDLSINKLVEYKKFIKKDESIYYKNLDYYKKRYLTYKKNEYLINKFKFKSLTSFFILKCIKKKIGSSYVILDHFGAKKIYSKHFSNLTKDHSELLFLSKKKFYKSKYELLNNINLKIGYIKKFNIKKKNQFLKNKEIFLGDTDIFMTLR